VGSVVALARRESPSLGDRFVGLSRALVHEMPHTMTALTDGGISERVAVAVVAGTAALSQEDRAEVDRRLGPVISRLGVRQAGAAAARVAAELDAAAVVARMEAAVKSRRVSVRPAPDGMAYLTVLGPLKDVVGAHAAVQARARGVVGGQCPEELPEGRGVGAVAADTALRLLSGRAVGQPQPVEVHLVMTDRSLLGTGDGDRSPFEPARIPGHGSVPAPVARSWLREGLTDPSEPAVSRDPVTQAVPVARVWVRRLYTTPEGRDLVAMDSRRRLFGGLLRRMLVLRDDVCTTPWCEAPIVHADHATPVREHAETTFEEGNGKCTRCNHGKEAPGWRTRVILTQPGVDEPPPERTGRAGAEARARRVVRVTTPLGHSYDAEPPPLLGWGSQTFPPTTALSASREEPPTRRGDGPLLWSWGSGAEGRSAAGGPRRAKTSRTNLAPKAKPRPKRQVGPAPQEVPPSWLAPVLQRKRPLRRARTLSGSTPDRPRPQRRRRLTSHLERQLCRYLT